MTKPSTTTGAADFEAERPLLALQPSVCRTKPLTGHPILPSPANTDRADRRAGLRAATDRFLAEILGPNPTGQPAVAPSARIMGSSSRHNDNVAAARHLLSGILADERNVLDTARWEARIARMCLLALVPAAVVAKFVADATWIADAMATPAGRVVLLAAAAFAAVGMRWIWLVTSPPFVLAGQETREDVARLMRLRESAQQLAVRLATGTIPAVAQHRVEMLNHLSLGTLSRVSSVGKATVLVEACTSELVRHICGPSNRVAIMTLLPFLTCLLPAFVLMLVI